MTAPAFGPPVASAAGDSQQEGFSGACARADHRHDRSTDAASLVAAAPPGAVTAYAGASAPNGWLLCDGSAVSRTTYAALFAILSTTYGAGDGSTTFNLPDMRGRTVVMVDGGAGRVTANNTLAASSGAQAHTHTEGAHTHTEGSHTHGVSATHTHTSAGHTHTSAAHSHALSEGNAQAMLTMATTSGLLAIRAVSANWNSNRSNNFAANGTATADTARTAATGLMGNTDSATPADTGSTTPGNTGASSPGATDANNGTGTGSSAGSGTGSTSTMQPYLVLNYIVKT